MLAMEIKYNEMLIRIFPRAFEPWEYESEYSGYINSRCTTIVTCIDADTDEIIGGGNEIDGINYDADVMGKHYTNVCRAVDHLIGTMHPENAIINYCLNELAGHGLAYVKFTSLN